LKTLKNIARLYVAGRSFVVNKIRRLLDKLVELLPFYVEIVVFIQAKQKTNKRYQNLKNNKQKSENKIQKYTKSEKKKCVSAYSSDPN
jgi:hypothetical protein